jgi:hypothetical protein
LARALGIAIILIGIAVAAWDAIELNEGNYSNFGSAGQFRYFLREAIQFTSAGGLVLVGAEIADRLGWGPANDVPAEEAQTALTPEN